VTLPHIADLAVKAIESSVRPSKRTARRRELRSDELAIPEGVDLSEERVLLISVKPQYAEAILDGTKTVELRRTRPSLPDGSLVLLYSSTPTRAVVGWAHLMRVQEGSPEEIWQAIGDAAAIDQETFDAYFHGAEAAYALELDKVVEATQPVPLSVIRSIGVQPPQSWRYLPRHVSHQIQATALG
jgi:predicted transcriptional regulator